ncbi:FAD-binding oxidoreductase [Caenispirillum bisanense]|uniref:FAD/FMN-containing dehydrogenase n=1 Tax=Caenispirillum bisanense TaxID=414052 RepID=A0A286GD19_9PROT|nr:FAD-binding oxidoreductase [Caenispirillum bisanense]SOD93400.1 FAD/FMN-containing dehydrogenase [Caenispirillum bisanense]
MEPNRIATLDGPTLALDDTGLAALEASMRGPLLTPRSAGYDEARRIWNGMIDRRPAVIARCLGTADVMACVRFAAAHRLLTAVRGGGHNIAGSAMCDGGLVIDLSLMRSVQVDPEARTARVEPGALLSDLDREAQAHGLAVPLGINSTTGVAGLTLGGGFGWLSRSLGMTVDSLTGAEMVTADGRRLRVDADRHAELLWGLRGGGANLGVVTAFDFALHPVGPQVFAGLIVHPLSQAADLLRRYRHLAAAAPDALTVWVVMRSAPPLPFLPPEAHGTPVLVFALCHSGTVEQAERDVAPLLALGAPVGVHVGAMPFAAWQAAFDPLLTPGARNYWKSHNFTALDDGLIDLLVDNAMRLPSPQSEIFIAQLGGAASRPAPDATAYPHRDAAYVMNVHTRWTDPADDAGCIAWARAFSDATAPFATGGVYVNFIPGDEDRVAGAYGANYDRLAALKATWDPTNLFRQNQNVPPATRPSLKTA